jgi:Sulfotransferase family
MPNSNMSNNKGKLPNFFLVGAPRAGSTSLYHHLDQHPEIFMSPMKEINYFADEMRDAQIEPEFQALAKQEAESLRRYLNGPMVEKCFGGIVTEWEDYCRLYAGVREERAIGEASICYLWSRSAPKRIAACMPDAKILMVLRNPIERAYSQHLQNVNRDGLRMSFREHLEAALARGDCERMGVLHPFLEMGLYAEQVLRYQRLFPAAQIGIWLYEDRNGSEFMREVYEFLGVDGGFVPDMSKRYLEQRIPQVPGLNGLLRQGRVRGMLRRMIPASMRSSLHGLVYKRSATMQMQREDRELLISYYREDVMRLSEVLERDLSFWLR